MLLSELLVNAALLLSLLFMFNVVAIASFDANQTTSSEEETRRVRRLEAEVEILRRSVTELRAAGPCATQQSSLPQEVRALRHLVDSMRMRSELSAIHSDLQSLRSRLSSDVTGVVKPRETVKVPDEQPPMVSHASASPGSAYTRWGKGQCPPDAQLVYSGVMGGSHFTQDGAASNALCLPLNPIYENYEFPPEHTWVYGAEYKVKNHPSHNLDPKCTVCHIARASTIMVPATKFCHPGWTLEYTGILMAGLYYHKAASEILCVDSTLEGVTGSENSTEGKLLYFVTSACYGLPCPPYISGKVLSCVVCSK